MNWYCIRTKSKQENLTAQFLRGELGMEVFSPRIRYKRSRITGIAWVLEAMFPCYVFARFDYPESHRRVRATRGVTRIVEFGGVPSIVSDEIIEQLKASVRENETIEVETSITPGEEVDVVVGPFRGVKALVTRVMPARERVAILLEILGTTREIEVPASAVMADVDCRIRASLG